MLRVLFINYIGNDEKLLAGSNNSGWRLTSKTTTMLRLRSA